MSMELQSCIPLVPSEAAIGKSTLPDKAIYLSASSSCLGGKISECTRQTIIDHMAVINSYYSNMIEGNPTEPYEIREAQKWIISQALTLDDVFTSEFIKSVHYEAHSVRL